MIWSVTATGISVALVSGSNVDEVVDAAFSAASTGTTTRGMEDSVVDFNVEVSEALASVVKFSEAEVLVSFSTVSSGTTTGTRVSAVAGTTVDSAVGVC